MVVSDLHLGALNSVLTNVGRSGQEVDRHGPAPALEALGDCVRTLYGEESPPELVVLGDLFELALTPLDDAAATFGHFARAVGLGQEGAPVSPTMRFVAGNHDHQLWTRARLDREVVLVAATPPGKRIDEPAHVTPLFPTDDGDAVKARFVEAVVDWAVPGSRVEVINSYPNFGLMDSSKERAVVMHHGHFIEHLYRIVSSLDLLFGASHGVPSADHLERDNAGWIDFFWSSEADSGDAGTDVRVLYESLVSGRTVDAEINRVSQLIARSRRGLVARLERYMVTRAALRAHHVLANRERHQQGAALSKDAETGLAMYLAGPVHRELESSLGVIPAETTFVFGHTHKPFVGTRGIPRYPRPIPVVNTGGWVIDHADPEPLKGATAVLVDDELNVVALEIYRQHPDGTVTPPAALPVGPRSVPFADAVRAALERDADTWSALTAALPARPWPTGGASSWRAIRPRRPGSPRQTSLGAPRDARRGGWSPPACATNRCSLCWVAWRRARKGSTRRSAHWHPWTRAR